MHDFTLKKSQVKGKNLNFRITTPLSPTFRTQNYDGGRAKWEKLQRTASRKNDAK